MGFKGVSDLVDAEILKDKKELEEHLIKLYKNLAKHATSAIEPDEIMWTRARIEESKWALSRFDARRISTREWLAFGITTGSLVITALALIVTILN